MIFSISGSFKWPLLQLNGTTLVNLLWLMIQFTLRFTKHKQYRLVSLTWEFCSGNWSQKDNVYRCLVGRVCQVRVGQITLPGRRQCRPSLCVGGVGI